MAFLKKLFNKIRLQFFHKKINSIVIGTKLSLYHRRHNLNQYSLNKKQKTDKNLFKINVKVLEYDLSKEYANLGKFFYNHNKRKKKTIVSKPSYKKSFEKIDAILEKIREYDN